ncbi:MAG: hypothetical protein ACRCWJ_21225, partial [Casimicrobium sp.]
MIKIRSFITGALNGIKERWLDAISQSTGPGDSGKAVLTHDDGKIHESLLPPIAGDADPANLVSAQRPNFLRLSTGLGNDGKLIVGRSDLAENAVEIDASGNLHVPRFPRQTAHITFHVAPAPIGQASAPGTQAQPTLARVAVQRLSELRNYGYTAAIQFADGTYQETEFDLAPDLVTGAEVNTGYPIFILAPERAAYGFQSASIRLLGNSSNASAVVLRTNFANQGPSVLVENLTVLGNVYASRNGYAYFRNCRLSEVECEDGYVLLENTKLIGGAVSGATGVAVRVKEKGHVELFSGSGPEPGTSWTNVLQIDPDGRLILGASYAGSGPATGTKVRWAPGGVLETTLTEAQLPGDQPAIYGMSAAGIKRVASFFSVNGKTPNFDG